MFVLSYHKTFKDAMLSCCPVLPFQICSRKHFMPTPFLNNNKRKSSTITLLVWICGPSTGSFFDNHIYPGLHQENNDPGQGRRFCLSTLRWENWVQSQTQKEHWAVGLEEDHKDYQRPGAPPLHWQSERDGALEKRRLWGDIISAFQ